MHVSKALRTGVMVIALGALAGCASNGGYKAYAPDKSARPQTIAILAPMNLPSHTLNNQGSPGKMFGALGALAEMPGQLSNTQKLDQLLGQAGFDFSTAFSSALKSKLEAKGYQVSLVPVSRKKPAALVSDMSQLKNIGADVLLDVVVWSVGYANISITDNDFRPDIKVDVALRSADADATLYSESIMYGYHNPFMSATDIEAPKEHFFDDMEQLFGDPAKTLDGLVKAVDAVASHVAGRLTET